MEEADRVMGEGGGGKLQATPISLLCSN